MSFFKQRKPRRFSLPPLYQDEQQQRLQTIRQRAEEDLGIASKKVCQPTRLHGVFTNATTHLRRRKQREKEGRRPLSTGVLVVLIVVCIMVCIYLMS